MDVITFVHQPRTRHKSSILDPVNQTLMGLIDDFIFRRPWFPGKSPQLPEEKGTSGTSSSTRRRLTRSTSFSS